MSARILLVEPDPIIAKSYAAALTKKGHKVDSVRSAQQAIQAADTNIPDAVVLEIEMAKHNGIEFLYEFKSYTDWQNIPIVILTRLPLQELGGPGGVLERELGVIDVLYKPHTSLEALCQVLENVTHGGKAKS